MWKKFYNIRYYGIRIRLSVSNYFYIFYKLFDTAFITLYKKFIGTAKYIQWTFETKNEEQYLIRLFSNYFSLIFLLGISLWLSSLGYLHDGYF